MADQGHEERLDGQLAKQIRSEITSQVARWTVAAIAALIIAAALGWWFYLSPIIENLVGVPRGAVAAFDTSGGKCPNGWEPLNDAVGRTIVGANVPGVSNLDEAGQGIVAPLFRHAGGHVSMALTRANLPSIPLEIEWRFSNVGLTAGGGQIMRQLGSGGTNDGDGGRSLAFEVGGQATPIGNLTPYLALAICKKG